MKISIAEPLSQQQAYQMDTLVLAFVGDAIHTLFIREKMSTNSNLSAGSLHLLCSKYCKAQNQEMAFWRLQQGLDEKEIELAKRARNHKLAHVPKHAELSTYKNATSYEALVGYFYLTNQTEKLENFLVSSLGEENDN